jgi:NADH-quinone oxidoreductase subunit D
VQLHALRRLPRGCFRGLARCDAQGGSGLPAFIDEFEALLSAQRDSDGALPGRWHSEAGAGRERRRDRAHAARVGCELRHSQGRRYGIYDRFKFRVPLGDHGDVYDRYMVRILEMRESIKILEQALKDIPAGPIMDPKAKIRGFRPKPGEAYGRIEAPKGELGFYLISDGGPNPYRYRVRPPSLINLTVLEDMCLGSNVADVVLIFGSVDIVLGEVDR